MHPRRERDADDGAFGVLDAGDGLAPRFGAWGVQHGVTLRFELSRRCGYGCGALQVELDADLRNRPIRGPRVGAEARLRGFPERPHAEVLATVDSFAIDVVVVAVPRRRFEWQAERTDEEFAAVRRVFGNDRNARNELHLHTQQPSQSGRRSS